MHMNRIPRQRSHAAGPPRRWRWLAAAPLTACLTAACTSKTGANPGIQRLHDVVTGDNSVHWHSSIIAGYHAEPGWDPVTGWGSPDAQYLVPLLARTARSSD